MFLRDSLLLVFPPFVLFVRSLRECTSTRTFDPNPHPIKSAPQLEVSPAVSQFFLPCCSFLFVAMDRHIEKKEWVFIGLPKISHITLSLR